MAATVVAAAVAAVAVAAVAASAATPAAAAAAGTTAAAVTDKDPRFVPRASRTPEIWRSGLGTPCRLPRLVTTLGLARTHTRHVADERDARADLTRGAGVLTPTATNEDDAMRSVASLKC